jgi:hypothetical protein
MMRRLLSTLLVSVLIPASLAHAVQDAKPAAPAARAASGGKDPLNVWLKNVPPAQRAASILWPAWIKAKPMPADGGVPMPADIWSGMPEAEAWSRWAAENGELAKALKEARGAIVLGVPYGNGSTDSAAKAKGLVAEPGSAIGEAAFPYLKAVRGYAAYAVLEMRRLGEQKKFDEAFAVGLDGLRMLRGAAEQRMAIEKAVVLELLVSSLEAHRVFLADHLGQIPAETLQRVALKEYPFLRPGDGEKLKRLEMPEGDVVASEAIFATAFGADGQPVGGVFAERFGSAQAVGSPITRFGAAAYWRSIADLHGSMDASNERMVSVFDDWWRRWRMPPYDPMNETPSEYSRLNPVRYAAVGLLASEMERVFRLRMRASAELNGTCMALGLCGFHAANKGRWPADLGRIFPQFALRKMNMDPYSRKYGTFEYRDIGDKSQAIDTPWGQVTATRGVLWAVGGDHEDGNFAKHDPPDGVGDLVMWPPPRQLAQKAGLLNK